MEKIIELTDADEARLVLGPRDLHLKQVRDACNIRVVARNSTLRLEGTDEQVERAGEIIAELRLWADRYGRLEPMEVQQIIYGEPEPANDRPAETARSDRRIVEARSEGQKSYLEAMDHSDVVFCIGPAGTGKTFLAVAQGVAALRAEQVKKIVLVRPVVEAGEKLGFLPGDIQAKVNPYIRPLYDALGSFIAFANIKKYVERDLIEIAPLAYMRGRTLNDAFVILDEAQNTSATQMKMFLTRLGEHSRMVITGDVTQIDLPNRMTSGLVAAEKTLQKVRGIRFVYLERGDIVRHRIVQQIVDAYEQPDGRKR